MQRSSRHSCGMHNSEMFLEMCDSLKKAQAKRIVCDKKAYGGMVVYMYLFLPSALRLFLIYRSENEA